MKNHVWRPLFVVIGVVALILVARTAYVPPDFGMQEQGYMYGFHRHGNEAEWKAQEINYKTQKYCEDCHPDKAGEKASSPHALIECENCHGPAMGHPDDPPKLEVDKSREQCLRCHAALPYPESGRKVIPGIDPDGHNPGMECVMCHNPHNPSLEGM
ncbi:MAG TPA: cytochrome c3 family protein [Nitrospirota bacterium]